MGYYQRTVGVRRDLWRSSPNMFPTVGYIGKHPKRSWISPQKNTPPPLCAACSSALSLCTCGDRHKKREGGRIERKTTNQFDCICYGYTLYFHTTKRRVRLIRIFNFHGRAAHTTTETDVRTQTFLKPPMIPAYSSPQSPEPHSSLQAHRPRWPTSPRSRGAHKRVLTHVPAHKLHNPSTSPSRTRGSAVPIPLCLPPQVRVPPPHMSARAPPPPAPIGRRRCQSRA